MLLASLFFVASHAPLPAAPRVGWSDELNRVKNWAPLKVENKPTVTVPRRGAMRLTLGARPSDWPYQYQWSGVERRAKIDVAHFPVLTAQVKEVKGYAHLDIDVLDGNGKAVRTLRTSTLTASGLSAINLAEHLDPAVYSLKIRLIVGGPNEGCSVTYDWIRATRR